jgi:hypothetical protein
LPEKEAKIKSFVKDWLKKFAARNGTQLRSNSSLSTISNSSSSRSHSHHNHPHIANGNNFASTSNSPQTPLTAMTTSIEVDSHGHTEDQYNKDEQMIMKEIAGPEDDELSDEEEGFKIIDVEMNNNENHRSIPPPPSARDDKPSSSPQDDLRTLVSPQDDAKSFNSSQDVKTSTDFSPQVIKIKGIAPIHISPPTGNHPTRVKSLLTRLGGFAD